MRSGCSDMPRAGPQGYTAFCGWEGVARSARDQAWDIFLTFLLVGSVALVFWYESTEDEGIRVAIERVDLVLVVFFLSEWMWRVRSEERRVGDEGGEGWSERSGEGEVSCDGREGRTRA